MLKSMVQNSTVSSLPRGLPPKAQRFQHRSCVCRTAKKTPTPPALKALPQIALCAAHHMLKHKPSEETSFHIYKTPLILLAKPFQIQHQRSPGSPPGRCGRHPGVAGIPSPAGPCPSAGTAAPPMAQRCQADSQHLELTF